MTLVLLLHPREGLLAVGGLSDDFPLVLAVLAALGAGLDGVLGVEVLGVDLASAELLLDGLDQLADWGALVSDAWVHLEASLVGLWGGGPLGLGGELVLHLSLLATGSVLELLLDLEGHLAALVSLWDLGLVLVLGFNAHVGLLSGVASIKDGLTDGLELALVLVQLLGGIVGGVTAGETDQGLSLLLLLATVGLWDDGHLGKVLEGVLLSFTDLLHLSLLGLGLGGGDWRDDVLLSDQSDGDGGVVTLGMLVGSDGSSHVDGVGLGLVQVEVELGGDV